MTLFNKRKTLPRAPNSWGSSCGGASQEEEGFTTGRPAVPFDRIRKQYRRQVHRKSIVRHVANGGWLIPHARMIHAAWALLDS